MSQAHFQTSLFQEIIQGIATSCEGYLLEGKEMVESAANIYMALSKIADEEKRIEKDSVAAGDTKLVTTWQDGQVNYSRISTCTSCNRKIIRFIADDLRFCPGCGRKIVE